MAIKRDAILALNLQHCISKNHNFSQNNPQDFQCRCGIFRELKFVQYALLLSVYKDKKFIFFSQQNCANSTDHLRKSLYCF
jgi:hypothetical protein